MRFWICNLAGGLWKLHFQIYLRPCRFSHGDWPVVVLSDWSVLGLVILSFSLLINSQSYWELPHLFKQRWEQAVSLHVAFLVLPESLTILLIHLSLLSYHLSSRNMWMWWNNTELIPYTTTLLCTEAHMKQNFKFTPEQPRC